MSTHWLEKSSIFTHRVNPETGQEEVAYVSKKKPHKVLEYLGKKPSKAKKDKARQRVEYYKHKGMSLEALTNRFGKFVSKTNPETGSKETAYVSSKKPSKVHEYLGKSPSEEKKEHAKKRVNFFKQIEEHPKTMSKVVKKKSLLNKKKSDMLDLLSCRFASHRKNPATKEIKNIIKVPTDHPDQEMLAELRERAAHGDHHAKEHLDKLLHQIKEKKASTDEDTSKSTRKVLVTRHPGLKQMFEEMGIKFDKTLDHVSCLDDIAGAHVYGVLPLSFAVHANKVTEAELDIPKEMRGKELSLQEVKDHCKGLFTYTINRAHLMGDLKHIGAHELSEEDMKSFPTDAHKQFLMGQKYEFGQGLDKDLGSAYYYYREAYKKGYKPALDAIKNLKLIYSSLGFLAKRASVNQDGSQLMWLGGTETSQGFADDAQGTARETMSTEVKTDAERLEEIKKEYADTSDDSEEAVLRKSESYRNMGGIDGVIKKLAGDANISNNTDPVSLYNSGLAYWAGTGTEANKAKAVDCFIEASQKGYKLAQVVLNRIREEGRF